MKKMMYGAIAAVLVIISIPVFVLLGLASTGGTHGAGSSGSIGKIGNDYPPTAGIHSAVAAEWMRTDNYPHGQCTSFVSWRLKRDHNLEGSFGGDAWSWGAGLKARGWVQVDNASPGDVVVETSQAVHSDNPYGHVAYVATVDPDGTVTIEEMNTRGAFSYKNDRKITPAEVHMNAPGGIIFMHDPNYHPPTPDGRENTNGGDGSDPKDYARKKLNENGWGEDQFACLDKLWTRESGWQTHAENKSSGAYGIPQSLPANKMSSAGSDWHDNPQTQINWGLDYIKGRYGDPCGAVAHSDSVGWY